jgi:hypothetical protein
MRIQNSKLKTQKKSEIFLRDFCPGVPPFSECPRRRAIFKKIQNFGVDARLRGDPEKGGPSDQKSLMKKNPRSRNYIFFYIFLFSISCGLCAWVTL